MGVPDEKWGESVVAVVVVKPNSSLTEREILHYCKKHLHDWKCPKTILLVELRRQIIQQQDRLSADLLPKVKHLPQDHCRHQQLCLAPGQHLLGPYPFDPELQIRAVRPYARSPKTPVAIQRGT